jgi:phage terminase Nu1 subunit (DNA packaging protein)
MKLPQHEKARAWREKLDLTRDQLSELTGYSVPAIHKFEAGSRNKQRGDNHSEWAWQRYRMACAGAAAQVKSGRTFEW